MTDRAQDHPGNKSAGQDSSYELVDNRDYGRHEQALAWLAKHYMGPLSIATGYLSLEGLDRLAAIASGRQRDKRLLLGAMPSSEAAMGRPVSETTADQFKLSIEALRRQRNFSAFPAARRAVLERVCRFIESDDMQVRHYERQFLHGKAYILGKFNVTDSGSLTGPGAALVSSANLTRGGLVTNLELGMVHYQPNVVQMALEWYQRLWQEARDFREELLDLLRPPVLESDPQTVFLRALLELYDADLEPREEIEPHPLTAFQRDGLARAKRIIDLYGGVLYADGVGMGKTEIGMQFVHEYTQTRGQHVLIISPAQLRDRLWQQRLSEANLPGKVVSYQELAQDRQLSRNGNRRVLPVNKDVYRLVIIDEAHAYRNVNNTWYAALDRLMGGPPKKLLLLTATPVNNSLWDLHNLFLLFGRHDAAFAGEPLRISSLRNFFADAGASDVERLSETKLFPLIDALTVRRDRAFIGKRYKNERFSDGTLVKFPKPNLREVRYDIDAAHPGIVRAVATEIGNLKMARYRPSAYRLNIPTEIQSETALAGLMQSQLLKRFESSWWAALKTVTRMRDASRVVLSCLEEQGGMPPPEIIRDIVGRGQDAFLLGGLVEETLAESSSWIPADKFADSFAFDLQSDADKLNLLARHLSRLEDKPDPKIEALRNLISEMPSQKIAIFTAFQDTATYLKNQFDNDPMLLGGRKWTVVIGADTDTDSRNRELERFCPASVRGDPKFVPEGGEVDVLLSTDVLSEGQNLQQAQAVLSFDMPWNPQRVVQRNGRIIRLRSPHETAYLYTLLPEQGDLDQLLKLEAKLQAKILAANTSVGMETPVLANMASETQIYADFNTLVNRLSEGDESLLDDQDRDSSAFAGELFRAYLRRATDEGEISRLRKLPWGIGAAFVPAHKPFGLDTKPIPDNEPAVFFACRTRTDERYWRVVSQSGVILLREDLPMLRLIDPLGQPGCSVPDDLDLEHLFAVAVEDICDTHNALADSQERFAALPTSQRWAIDILRSQGSPAGPEYDNADIALSVGRNNIIRRQLSALRRDYNDHKVSVPYCAQGIVELVTEHGLRPVEPPATPSAITEKDLGVVCYQVILPDAHA